MMTKEERTAEIKRLDTLIKNNPFSTSKQHWVNVKKKLEE